MIEQIKVTGDFLAAGVTVGVVAQWIPPLAGLLTIIYTALRIYEWIESRRARKNECQKRKDEK